LLLNRNTVTLGSFIIIGVMTNVFVMNLTYDIPVKLFSFHLLLMSLLLFIGDWYRVKLVFFKNENEEKIDYFKLKLNKNLQKLIVGGKGIIKGLIVIIVLIQCFVKFDLREQLKERSELYGIWETKLFVKNRDTLAPLLTDSYQWRYLIIDSKKKATIKKMNEALDKYDFQFDDVQNQLIFNRENDTLKAQFFVNFKTDKELYLKGSLEEDTVLIHLKRKPKSDFRLVNRGFHWINESTYNY
jgi:hypothetical protein